jgi:hypothetical protein
MLVPTACASPRAGIPGQPQLFRVGLTTTDPCDREIRALEDNSLVTPPISGGIGRALSNTKVGTIAAVEVVARTVAPRLLFVRCLTVLSATGVGSSLAILRSATASDHSTSHRQGTNDAMPRQPGVVMFPVAKPTTICHCGAILLLASLTLNACRLDLQEGTGDGAAVTTSGSTGDRARGPCSLSHASRRWWSLAYPSLAASATPRMWQPITSPRRRRIPPGNTSPCRSSMPAPEPYGKDRGANLTASATITQAGTYLLALSTFASVPRSA